MSQYVDPQYGTRQNPLLGLGAGRDIARPSQVLPPPGADSTSVIQECTFCGAHPHMGPEREKWSVEHHCWRCGFRPDLNNGVSEYQLRQQFDAFQRWLANQTQQDYQHPTLQPPTADDSEIADMKARIEDMQNKLAERMGPGGVTPNQVSMKPGG